MPRVADGAPKTAPAKKPKTEKPDLKMVRQLLNGTEGIKVNAGPFTNNTDDAYLVGVMETFRLVLGKENHVIERLLHTAEKIKPYHKEDCGCGSCRFIPVLREMQA